MISVPGQLQCLALTEVNELPTLKIDMTSAHNILIYNLVCKSSGLIIHKATDHETGGVVRPKLETRKILVNNSKMQKSRK